MRNSLLLASMLAVAVLVEGCGEPAPVTNAREAQPRPAPGTPTKDVMVPTAK